MRMKTYMGFLAVVLALAGCDDGDDKTDAGMTDGGMMTGDDGGMMTGDDGGMTGDDDGGMTDDDGGTGGGESCDDARTIALEMGEQTITGDTTGRSADESIEGDGCIGDPAPQEFLALTIPGTGEKVVSFTLATDDTSVDFDTIVQLRADSCESPAAPVCFDDIDYPAEARSGGAFLVEGGSTVYLVVTGFAAPPEVPANQGPWGMVVTVDDLDPPTITAADAFRVASTHYDILVDGADPNGNAEYVELSFLADGTPIEVDLDGDPSTPGETVIGVDFMEPVEGETEFTGALVQIAADWFLEETAAATEVEVTLVDTTGLKSDPLTIPIRVGAAGEACDATLRCAAGYECVDSACAVAEATATFCAAATSLELTAAAPTASATGALEPTDPSYLSGSCAYTIGPEGVYTVTVPAGAYDLVATTDNAETDEGDTVLYIQNTCGDPATELVCNDDIDFFDDNWRSLVVLEDVTEGTYTVVVETWGIPSASLPYQLDVSLRPVLGAGAACDPAGVANRCSTGPCPTSGTAECPAAP